ncbi:MAG: putative CRISPR-associated protein [Thermodesulfovibrio sp.]|nr:putative CRISPR-associated protein [Thermodesulfovibrio sp.]
MREIHIISTGNSIISNAQKNGIIDPARKISDETFWLEIINNKKIINDLLDNLRNSPFKWSAELNTFLRVVQEKNPENIEVYLFGTKTSSNELCRRLIEVFLKERGYKIYVPYEVSGYFLEACFDEKIALDEFKKGISELIDRLIYIARIKKREGYKVYFNPTGGLKAHVITTAFVAFVTECDIYYMNEEFNQVVFFPKLFYIPKGKELELLEQIAKSEEKEISSHLIETYNEEIDRLQTYDLIKLERKDHILNIYLTNKGKLIYQEMLK